jgi:predicted nucleic acid-binding protein
MSGERFSLDTNVLVYAVDIDAGERHGRLRELVDRAIDVDCVLTLQVLGEFFHAVTRNGRKPTREAAEQVRDWQTLFPVVAAQAEDFDRAVMAVLRHGLTFWDAMLWSTAKAACVTVLLTEDFQRDRVLEGVRFRNPFGGTDPLRGESSGGA